MDESVPKPPTDDAVTPSGCDRSIRGPGGIRRWERSPLAQEVFILNNLMIRVGDQLVKDKNLTSARWMLLAALKDYDTPPTMTELSRDRLLSIQNVSRMVSAMESDGLVERVRESARSRTVRVEVTEAGASCCMGTEDCGRAFTEHFLKGFSEGEVEVLRGLVDRLILNLEAYERELSSPGGSPGSSETPGDGASA